jgi:predicted metal-dependent TIM-barrel fold hydrolase
LITEADKHEEKDYIYSELFKKLQLADSNDLPVLIYNTSKDYNIHENIIDVLLKNNAAINLAQLILKLAFR